MSSENQIIKTSGLDNDICAGQEIEKLIYSVLSPIKFQALILCHLQVKWENFYISHPDYLLLCIKWRRRKVGGGLKLELSLIETETKHTVRSRSLDMVLLTIDERQFELHWILCILLSLIIFLSTHPLQETFLFDHLLLFPFLPKKWQNTLYNVLRNSS